MGNLNEGMYEPPLFQTPEPIQIEPTKPLPLNHDLVSDIVNKTGCFPLKQDTNLHNLLTKREIGIPHNSGPTSRLNGARYKVHTAQRFLPLSTGGEVLRTYNYRIFCGNFSPDGSIFMSATQDRKIRFYETNTWTEQKVVGAREVGWSILGTDYSPDQQWLIYSGWSDSVHLTNVTGDHQKHEALDFNKENYYFCLFSVKFSPDSNEILGGSSDHCLYVYDLSRKEVVMRVKAHDHDINTVSYGENGDNNLMFSAGDDCLIKVWDRRLLTEKKKDPVGLLIGHTHGITHVAPRGDGIHLISNGKDQYVKLWDIRKMDTNIAHTSLYSKKSGDYRYGILKAPPHPNDLSISSYSGHEISKTLIRCNFSPLETTGQKYIYTGSSNGCIYIYDIITGKLASKLNGHLGIVRDLSWHPFLPYLVSTSWDGSIGKWKSREESTTKFNPNTHRENTRYHQLINNNVNDEDDSVNDEDDNEDYEE